RQLRTALAYARAMASSTDPNDPCARWVAFQTLQTWANWPGLDTLKGASALRARPLDTTPELVTLTDAEVTQVLGIFFRARARGIATNSAQLSAQARSAIIPIHPLNNSRVDSTQPRAPRDYVTAAASPAPSASAPAVSTSAKPAQPTGTTSVATPRVSLPTTGVAECWQQPRPSSTAPVASSPVPRKNTTACRAKADALPTPRPIVAKLHRDLDELVHVMNTDRGGVHEVTPMCLGLLYAREH
ncbi:hypothetical protein KEM56_005008, partial [Ascosphaera pollenicola]